MTEDIVEEIPNLTIISTHTAELGLSLAEDRKPDVIILDINLPGMNGFEAVRHLKELDATKDIPVFALSANTVPASIERGRQAGFREYLTKPIDVPRFMAALQGVLGEITWPLDRSADWRRLRCRPWTPGTIDIGRRPCRVSFRWIFSYKLPKYGALLPLSPTRLISHTS